MKWIEVYSILQFKKETETQLPALIETLVHFMDRAGIVFSNKNHVTLLITQSSNISKSSHIFKTHTL